jgi:hypothetical protein
VVEDMNAMDALSSYEDAPVGMVLAMKELKTSIGLIGDPKLVPTVDGFRPV